MTGFVGRASELRLLDEQLAAARAGRPRVVVVEGAAGSGKSTLLAHFRAALPDGVVITGSGEEGETLLGYGVVNQLDPGIAADPGADPMTVGAGLLDLLGRSQSAGRVVVLVVDDLHWADRSSARALLFALRRLRADRVLALVSVRPGELPDAGWARFVAGDARASRIRLGALTPAEVAAMAAALGLGTLPTRGATRLVEHTGGNPLYCRALLEELGVAALSRGHGGLPAPRALAVVVVARVAALAESTQEFLAAAAVLGRRAEVAAVAAVAGLDGARAELDEAVAAGLVVEALDAAQVGFVHPLYQAAVHADLSPTRRRDLHARAARVVGDDAALSHRVAAAVGPDEALATALEETGRAAEARGDAPWAGWLLERSAALSARPGDRDRRLLDAAEVFLDAADTDAATRVLASAPTAGARRDALLGLLDVYTARPTAEVHLRAAWAAHDRLAEPVVGARAATSLAVWLLVSGRAAEALTWADRAVDGTVAGTAARGQARTAQAGALASAGRGVEGLDRLGFLPAAPAEVPLPVTDALIMRGLLKVFTDDLTGATADLSVAAARVHAGVTCTYPGQCLTYLGEAHHRRGDWDAAAVHAELTVSLIQDTDRAWDLASGHAQAALVPAARGEWAVAQAHLDAARSAAERAPTAFTVAAVAAAGAALAFARGDLPGVLAAADQVRDAAPGTLAGTPGVSNWRGFAADALTGLGRLDEAGAALDAFEAANPAGLASAALTVARCRGNLAAARGDGDTAAAAFEQAHRLVPRVPMPFEHALLRLDDGRRLRRAGDRPAALVELSGAHRLFSELGAVPYVGACSTELAAAGVTATVTAEVAALGLSAAELAVARLVATGRTNREVAAEMYLSVKTVEYHLRNTYGKLGITSRRALPALLR